MAKAAAEAVAIAAATVAATAHRTEDAVDAEVANHEDTAMRNTFGHLFTLTTFGESHGTAVGGVIDGMPAGIDIDIDFI